MSRLSVNGSGNINHSCLYCKKQLKAGDKVRYYKNQGFGHPVCQKKHLQAYVAELKLHFQKGNLDEKKADTN